MMDRLRYAKRLRDVGLYEVRGLVAWLCGAVASLGVLAALDPAMLPDSLVPFTKQIHDFGKWALLVGAGAGIVAGQSKRPLPRLPLTGVPSLLDDERDDERDDELGEGREP